jgi:phenylacetaldehyde dehydrogenase
MKPVIISVGINGGELTRDQTPYLPVTPDEIIESVCESHAAGCAVAHIHVRDNDGNPTDDLDRYRYVVQGIRSRCDVIINLTTDVRRQGFETLELRPELASFPGGSVNYGEDILQATAPVLRTLAERMSTAGTRAELEIFHDGMIGQCLELAHEGLLPAPLYFQFLLGLRGGAPADPKTLLRMVDTLPAGAEWGVVGLGGSPAGVSMAMMGMVLGGHVRVGIEDHVEYHAGRLARSNAELVERVVRIAREYDRPVATAAAAREILQLGTNGRGAVSDARASLGTAPTRIEFVTDRTRPDANTQANGGRSPYTRRMLIGDEWVDAASGRTFETVNPATGGTLAHVAEGDAIDVDRAVRCARTEFDRGTWPRLTASDRGRILWRLGDLIEQHVDELAELETLDNGKPITVAKAADVPLAAELFRYMAGWATKLEGSTIPLSVPYTPGAEYHAYTLNEPVGVVGQIIPWNFPLLMAAWKLGPALAAGCTVVLKPAEQTPLSALRLGELALEAGLPPGVLNIVTGFGETAGAALARHPDVDKVAFTGSTEVGKLIVRAAADNLKKVSLELGGKSPNVVFRDADLETAIAGAASAIFFNHGQCCCAGSRLYVEGSRFDDVVAGVSELAQKIRVGPGLDPETEMGPLVSDEQLTKVYGYVEGGINAGARAVTGGRLTGGQGYFLEPTVLVNTNPSMKVVQEEIFGPVVTAMPFKDVEDILPVANETRFGLAAGVWTSDVSKAHRVARAIRAGTVWVNCYNIFDAALPFGGYKESGWGREMGREVLSNYTETKAVCVHL